MKLVVITNGNFFARVNLSRLFIERYKDIAGVVVITGVKANKSRLRSLLEIWQQSGWEYFLYKSITYLFFAIAGLLFPGRVYFVPGLAKRFSIPVMYTSQVNAPDVVLQTKEWNPDLLISVSCPQRIRKEILSIPTRYAINIHASLLPQYAGIAPYVWVLANGETLTGTTVHLMEESFDTGHIILQNSLEITENESAFSLFLRLTELGSDVLAESVSAIIEGLADFTPQERDKNTYFSWPTPESTRALFENGHRLSTMSDYIKAIHSVD